MQHRVPGKLCMTCVTNAKMPACGWAKVVCCQEQLSGVAYLGEVS